MPLQKGFAHILLLLIIVVVAVVGFLAYTGAIKIPGLASLFQKGASTSVQTKYENPFKKETQYVNPFDKYKNPFVVSNSK